MLMIVIQNLFVFFKRTLKRLKQDDCMLSLFGLALKQSQSLKFLEMHKKSRLLAQLATLLVICMGVLLLYVWFNFDNLRSEQAYRQMWYLNLKFEKN